jgi:hypothetical protein
MQFGDFRGESVLRPSYREVTRFSEQVQRYFEIFGRERVHVIWFGDFAIVPAVAYEMVLSLWGCAARGEIVLKSSTPANVSALKRWSTGCGASRH